MSDPKAASGAWRVGRLGTVAAWISAVCCLPYLVLKVVWTFDVPLGLSDESVLNEGGWVAANALMAVVQLVAVVVVLALVRPWARKVPVWLLLFPVWVGTGLLFEVAVGAALAGLSASASGGSGADLGGIRAWVYVMVYVSFAGQGIALAIAFACHVRARWGHLLGRTTGEVVGSATVRVRSWPERHLAGFAKAVAAMAVVVAIVCGYWAAGGDFGLSDAQAHPLSSMQVARAVGAVVAVLGLLALAGLWARGAKFWLPVALTWLGSGALTAFDGFLIVLNRLLMSATDGSASGWALADTFLVGKVVIGVLAAAVCVVAIRAAVEDDRLRSSSDVPRAEARVSASV